MFSKTIELIGENNFEKIKNSKICVVGIGGVGGFVVENFVRTGVQNICIIDFDIIEKSNINRQIIATNSTISRVKVDVMAERILDINSNCNVKKFNDKLTAQNIGKFNLQNYDFVIDCIDTITDKIALICYCKEQKINIISALGAGNRFGIPSYEITDIFKTQNDGLAKVLRKKLRENGIENLTCVCSKNQPDKKLQNPASIMWQPATCGNILAGYVINKIIEN